MTVAEQKIEFVHVVDAEGNAMAGFSDPVPSHWIGTELLPEGAKKAPKHREEAADGGDVDALSARVAELEAENTSLREQLAVFQAGSTEPPAVEAPAGNASQETWATYARTQGATDADLDGLGRDELREKYGPKA